MRAVVLALLFSAAAGSATALAQSRADPPYEPQLLRLAEVLGSLHFLRRLCNANEGAIWRDAMAELLAAEKPSEARSKRMTARFNRGFGAFSRTYTSCTPAAVRASELYQAEGIRLTSQVVSRYAR